jgi:hypothetical protein
LLPIRNTAPSGTEEMRADESLALILNEDQQYSDQQSFAAALLAQQNTATTRATT